MKAHYYRLEGDSLEALDGLVAYDRQRNGAAMDALWQAMRDRGVQFPGPESDKGRALTQHFTAAQVRGWQSRLGFDRPAVTVRNYGDGALYRAYHTFPKIAMNPGTSKRNFGMVDLFRDPAQDAGRKRLAIFTSYEDYKGRHFVPPGAIKMTDEEFASLQPYENRFEYYRTYDEGIALPRDFKPARHQSIPQYPHMFNFSHVFLVQGQAQKDLNDHDKAQNDWFMSYQDFRDKDMGDRILPAVLGRQSSFALMVHDDVNGRYIELTAAPDVWARDRAALEQHFSVLKFVEDADKGHTAHVVPRADTVWGQQAAERLAAVLPTPRLNVDLGFKERPTLQNHARFDDEITGFPYMQVERHGDEKLLVFRLPPYVRCMKSPPDCTAITLDEYKALGGVENAPHRAGWPTHVFRIGGDARQDLDTYDAAMADYKSKMAAVRAQFIAMCRTVVPDFEMVEFLTPIYEDPGRLQVLDITLPKAMYDQAKDLIERAFSSASADGGLILDQGYANSKLWLVPRKDTAEGQAWREMIKAVPYEPNFPLYKTLGFNTNDGYDQMSVKTLSGLKQKAVVFKFPDYIHDVDAPASCVRLTKKEYALILAESVDLSAGSPPPPRPANLMHLPLPEGYASYDQLMAMKRAKDRDGLPLHERTEFNWFRIKRPDGPR